MQVQHFFTPVLIEKTTRPERIKELKAITFIYCQSIKLDIEIRYKQGFAIIPMILRGGCL